MSCNTTRLIIQLNQGGSSLKVGILHPSQNPRCNTVFHIDLGLNRVKLNLAKHSAQHLHLKALGIGATEVCGMRGCDKIG